MYLFYNSDGHLTFTKQFEQKQNQMNVNISIKGYLVFHRYSNNRKSNTEHLFSLLGFVRQSY